MRIYFNDELQKQIDELVIQNKYTKMVDICFLQSEADFNIDYVLMYNNGHINVIYGKNAKNKQYLDFGNHNHQVHELKCDAKFNQKCRWYIEIEVLDEVEKRYLSRVINPFKNKVAWIMKIKKDKNEYQYIKIMYTSKEYTLLPRFTKDAMYKEMELNKPYTLTNLGLL